jgi:predicted ATPase
MTVIRKIRIEGYKSIREMDLELRPLNILIGANGSGKSNFIAAFKFIRDVVEQRLQEHVAYAGGTNTLLHFGSKTTPNMGVEIEFDELTYFVELRATVEERLLIRFESFAEKNSLAKSIRDYGEMPIPESRLKTEIQSASNGNSSSKDALRQKTFNALQQVNVFHFHDTSDTAKVKRTGDLFDAFYLRPDASNLAAFLYTMRVRNPQHYRRIVETVQLVAPFFEDFFLEPTALNPEKIQLLWEERGSDDKFGAHILSDGTLRFICLATLLLQPSPPPIILIDEPELGLHPYALYVLGGLLSAAAVDRQVIVTTQSVTLVDQFAPEDIVVVDKREGASNFHRVSGEDLTEWLEDYSLGELWEKNILGGTPV